MLLELEKRRSSRALLRRHATSRHDTTRVAGMSQAEDILAILHVYFCCFGKINEPLIVNGRVNYSAISWDPISTWETDEEETTPRRAAPTLLPLHGTARLVVRSVIRLP